MLGNDIILEYVLVVGYVASTDGDTTKIIEQRTNAMDMIILHVADGYLGCEQPKLH